MDAPRELHSAAPLENQHHETSESSSRRSATPSTSSEEASESQHQSLEGGSPSLPSAENYKLTPDTTSSTIDMAPSSPLESSPSSITIASLPLTPSHSSSEPFTSAAPSWPTVSSHGGCIQRLSDYYAELSILMNGDGVDGNTNNTDNTDKVMNSDGSSNAHSATHDGEANPDLEHGVGSNEDVNAADDRQPYRHGQLGVFRHFSRFDQASRPIVSDNWRAKSAAESGTRPQPSSLMTSNMGNSMANSLSPVTSGRSHLYTPIRSPLLAPVNSNIAGFAQANPNSNPNPTPSPKPPPTPVSLSTPISMTFPGRSTGYGHAHHSSGGSFGTSNGFSPTLGGGNANMAPTSAPAYPIATQMNSLSLHNGNNPLSNSHGNNNNGATRTNTGSGYGNGHGQGTATFPVTIFPDTLAYCFIRPNGTRTRLVPVDMLPCQLQGVPAQETGNERLVVLPVPAGVEGDGRSTNNQVLKAVTSPGGNSGSDAIQMQTPTHSPKQSHIDRILAAPLESQPPSPAYHQQQHDNSQRTHPSFTSNPAQSQSQVQAQTALTPTSQNTNSHHHNNTNNSHTTNNNKKMKIYCDKWVHEGVCAFTQQGCKYKHEMPADKATQHQLGLFLGYPVWWKRRQGELARAQVPRRGVAVNGGLAASRWGSGLNSPGGNNGDGVEHGSARDRLLPPSWRTPASIEAARRYPNPQLQSYDGADASPVERHELVRHRHTAPEPERGMRGFTVITNNINNNKNNTSTSTPTTARSWPWEEQHYGHRTLQPQSQQPPQAQSYQLQAGQPNSGGLAACPFAFHHTTPTPTSTSPSTSPYGPIAPPPRNPRPSTTGATTTTTTTTDANTNSSTTTDANTNGGTNGNDTRAAQEVPNPYAALPDGGKAGAGGGSDGDGDGDDGGDGDGEKDGDLLGGELQA
ncbi:hypothetical protein B0I37DRAFT_433924 [Chaetomium sp. MPI-CAGE-AT-0009]|nr:hypothetical protein B0I37DRAFT_433924 [Chaetomium sp. MPI-CAGE-AT-0009]